MVYYVRITPKQVAAVPPPYRPLPPTDADRAKARELAEQAFACAMRDEGYLLPDALDEDAVVELIATALAEARRDGAHAPA